MTVVTGANESGKSTLHGALVNGLFGFSSADRRQQAGTSAKERCHPWDGKPFGMTLTLLAIDGRTVRLDWDFAQDRLEASDAVTGKPLLQEQPQQRTDFSSGPAFLGVSREEYRQLSCLFQEGLELVEPTASLRQTLQRAVEAVNADERGVDEADARLRDLLSRIGVNSSHYGAVPTGRLRQIEGRIAALERDFEAAVRARAELENLATQQAQQQNSVRDLERATQQLEQARLRHEAKRLHDDLEEAHSLIREAPAGDRTANRLPRDLPGRVAGARDTLSAARDEHAKAAALAEKVDLEPIQTALRTAESELERLEPFATVVTDTEDEVRDALGTLTAAPTLGAAPEPPLPRDPLLQHFREGRQPEGPDTAGRGTPHGLLAGAIAVGVVGIAVAVAITPAALALVLLAGVMAFFAVRGGPHTSAQSPAQFEGQSVAELARRATEEDRAWITYEGARAEHDRIADRAKSQRVGAGAGLDTLLARVAPGDGSLQDRANSYLTHCAKYRAWLTADGRLKEVKAQHREAMEPARRLRTADENVDRAEEELRRLLAQAEVHDDELEAALAHFAEIVRADADATDRAEQSAAAGGRLDQLLAGRTVDQLSAQSDEARDRLATHEHVHGPLEWSGDFDQSAAGRLAEERTTAVKELAALRTRQEEREATIGDPADIELQLSELRSEQERLLEISASVRIARAQIREAAGEAHRRVAPHLNRALEQALPRITRGRYESAMVDEDLTIRVIPPGTNRPVSVDELSRGTRDQIALVERLELARLLYPAGEGAPLLLDDCFAHTDAHRLPLVMKLLADVARSRQVIVFSDDRDVVSAVNAVDHAATVIELPDPVVDFQPPSA